MDSIIHGDKKIAKAERKPADNSTCLHLYIFETNTGKLQSNESVIVSQLRGKLSSLESYQKYSKHTSKESVTESEVLLIQYKIYNNKKYNTKKCNTHVQIDVELS